MIISDEFRRCVVFLGYRMADGQFRLAGSAFFFGRQTSATQADNVFLITARHVVDGIRKKGLVEVYVRANTKAGGTVWAKTQLSDWRFHPTDQSVDVAVLLTGVSPDWDHLVAPDVMCATDEAMAANEVALGDEVFVVGLFRHHHGASKNIPIVRVGNLAALAEEKVVTRDFGPMDAYLVEARSIGGLSGSPVFLNLGVVRYVGNQVKHAEKGPIHLLLGLIHGHFDTRTVEIDDAAVDTQDEITVERVNTGIAIVAPIQKVLEVVKTHSPQ